MTSPAFVTAIVSVLPGLVVGRQRSRPKEEAIGGLGRRKEREASGSAPSMANKIEDDLRDDDGERGRENDTQNYAPHAPCGVIKAIKFAQHWYPRSWATTAKHTGGTCRQLTQAKSMP